MKEFDSRQQTYPFAIHTRLTAILLVIYMYMVDTVHIGLEVIHMYMYTSHALCVHVCSAAHVSSGLGFRWVLPEFV
jgi:hypothetical protein